MNEHMNKNEVVFMSNLCQEKRERENKRMRKVKVGVVAVCVCVWRGLMEKWKKKKDGVKAEVLT